MRQEMHIFIIGNCQAQFLGAFLEGICLGRVTVVGEPYAVKPSFLGMVPRFLPYNEAIPRLTQHLERNETVVLIRQASPMQVADIELGALAAKISANIVIPHLELYSPWPEARRLKDVDDKKLLRLLRGDLAAIKSSARKSTIFTDAAEVVEALARSRPCFNSWVHPRGDLIRYIAEPLLSAVGGESLLAGSQAAVQELNASAGIDFDCAHPVPLHRLRVLGLDWGEHYTVWAEGREALARGDARTAYECYSFALTGFPASWKLRSDLAVAAFAVGDVESGLSFMEWARASNLSGPWLQQFALNHLLNHGMEPAAVYHRAGIALKTHGDYAPLHLTLGRICLRDPNLGEAETHARRAFELAPTEPSFACFLAHCLWANSRRQEAITVLDDFLAEHPDSPQAVAEQAAYRQFLELDRTVPDTSEHQKTASCSGSRGSLQPASAYKAEADKGAPAMTQVPLATDEMYDDEMAYWRQSYSSKPRGDLEKMISPTRPLDQRVVDAVSQTADGVIRVLDVGCGPISVLGWHRPDVKIELTGADPLADQYEQLLRELGFALPYRSYAAGGEELQRQFASSRFDYVFSRNALDHAADAPLAVRNMVEVAREGGVIEIEVFENEGAVAGYAGLHRWNFCQLDEQVLVWNRSTSLLLDYIASPYTYTFAALPKGDGTDRNRLIITIHKRTPERLNHHPVAGVVDVYYDLGRRILQLRSLRGDRKNKIFLHTFGIDDDGKESIHSKSYTWPVGCEFMYMKFPRMREISAISLGEFHVEYVDGESRFVNHWQTKITA